MMNRMKLWGMATLAAIPAALQGQTPESIPFTERVNVQTDSARSNQILDDQWVVVGTKKPYTFQLDYTKPFNGKPSYRFELNRDDNTLKGYNPGETKGRVELCYCYATSKDFADKSKDTYLKAQKIKDVYHYGKGFCEQGSKVKYSFSVYVPKAMSNQTSTIFAQWHGMPTRTLAQNPEGEVVNLTEAEFLALEEKTIFVKNIGYDKVEKVNKNGRKVTGKGKPNGWLIEQGGYPPLAFGFSDGFFYIKANSDRKWLTDKTDRCNANVAKAQIMKPVKSEYKSSTIAYKEPYNDFPKDCWVTFEVEVEWTKYGKEQENILKTGQLDVVMNYEERKKAIKRHLVDHQSIMIGRNDENGYYFKFGIYRVGNSTEPVCYNLANYVETVIQ